MGLLVYRVYKTKPKQCWLNFIRQTKNLVFRGLRRILYILLCSEAIADDAKIASLLSNNRRLDMSRGVLVV